jgi:hypothetical protein
MTPSDPYALLEVGPDATPEELKQAYRRLAKRWHPDRNPHDPTAADKFKAIASAFELLSDPARRRTFEVRRGRGSLDEEFLDRVATAVERGQNWAEQVVVPHFASLYRGGGAEMAASFVRVASEARPGRFTPHITPWGRYRAQRWLRRVQVSFDPTLGAPTAFVQGRAGMARILISPGGLWNAGIHTAEQLDELLLVLIVARYAQWLATGRFVPPRGESEEDWALALELARARDNATVRWNTMWASIYVLVLGLLVFMIYAGLTNW